MTSTLTGKWASEGFTLLEVLISMGLIAIALFAVFKLQAQNLDLHLEASFLTRAGFLAQDRLARIQARDRVKTGERLLGFTEDFTGFLCREEIKETGDKEGLYAVSLTISNPDAGPAAGLTLETYLYRPSGE